MSTESGSAIQYMNGKQSPGSPMEVMDPKFNLAAQVIKDQKPLSDTYFTKPEDDSLPKEITSTNRIEQIKAGEGEGQSAYEILSESADNVVEQATALKLAAEANRRAEVARLEAMGKLNELAKDGGTLAIQTALEIVATPVDWGGAVVGGISTSAEFIADNLDTYGIKRIGSGLENAKINNALSRAMEADLIKARNMYKEAIKTGRVEEAKPRADLAIQTKGLTWGSIGRAFRLIGGAAVDSVYGTVAIVSAGFRVAEKVTRGLEGLLRGAKSALKDARIKTTQKVKDDYATYRTGISDATKTAQVTRDNLAQVAHTVTH